MLWAGIQNFERDLSSRAREIRRSTTESLQTAFERYSCWARRKTTRTKERQTVPAGAGRRGRAKQRVRERRTARRGWGWTLPGLTLAESRESRCSSEQTRNSYYMDARERFEQKHNAQRKI